MVRKVSIYVYFFNMTQLIFIHFRSHTIRSVTLFDEKGVPKYDVMLEIDKPVQVIFDILSEDLSAPDSHQTNSMHHNVPLSGGNIMKKDLVCAFWDSQNFKWSSDGCNTSFIDGIVMGDIHPKGILMFINKSGIYTALSSNYTILNFIRRSFC